MKRYSLLLATLLLLSTVAGAQNDKKKEVWGEATIIANTITSTFGEHTNVQKSLTAYYTTNLKAPDGAHGFLTVPAGLGPGPKIPLKIQNHDHAGTGAEMRHYWGCSQTILKDQPEVLKGQYDDKTRKWQVGSTGMADPMQMMGITEASKAAGDYAMNVSYIGVFSLTMGQGQEFLPALKLVEPAADKVDLSQAVKISWEKVAGCSGYTVMVSGKDAQGRTTYWENAYNSGLWQRMGATKALEKGLILPPDKTTCTLPGGIFSGQATITVTAVSQIAVGKGPFSLWGWAQSSANKILNMGG